MATLTATPVAAAGPSASIPWQAVSVIDAAGLIGMSRQVIYDAINSGDLRARKVRGKARIDIHDLRDWFHDQPEVDD